MKAGEASGADESVAAGEMAKTQQQNGMAKKKTAAAKKWRISVMQPAKTGYGVTCGVKYSSGERRINENDMKTSGSNESERKYQSSSNVEEISKRQNRRRRISGNESINNEMAIIAAKTSK